VGTPDKADANIGAGISLGVHYYGLLQLDNPFDEGEVEYDKLYGSQVGRRAYLLRFEHPDARRSYISMVESGDGEAAN